ncbi:hypothetical protein VP1G_03479 [Cytospora mali]|uniref:6-hydroxy-D-nicotine oxidase n=1 Tax=Cytospora mali TaxID=578113 RepID=A0A194UWZ9_CYTMA|nr:hypothetical protein VP1G_03479 [Valsa mali var. pyri (nom. inval.)]
MPSYAITGATSGIGFAFIKNLSADPANTVIALVRDETKAREKISEEFPGRKNIHVVHGDIGNTESLKAAAGNVAAITGGGLDVLIANANFYAANEVPIGKSAIEDPNFDEKMQESFRINVVGNTHLMADFIPLIRQGNLKKVVVLSSGMGDISFVLESNMEAQSVYSISKAALNFAVAKFQVQYKEEGILFMAISPGVVNTHPQTEAPPPEAAESIQRMMASMKLYAPDFDGPISPEKSVEMVNMKVNDEQSDKTTPSTPSPTLATTSRTEAAIRCLQRCSVPFLSSQSTNWINDTATLNTRVPHTPALLVYARTVQHVQDVIACGVEAGLKAGRAISHGSCPAVGISGHILHGGYGWTSHNKGLTLDWMVGADVVLANGTQIHCSETEHADLFWALRGAGSNFGVVTSYKLKTFAAPSVSIPFSVSLNWNTEDQKVNGVKELVEFARNMPVDLNMRLNIHNSGDHTFDGAYYGNAEDLFNILEPLLQKTGGTLNARPGTWIQGLEAYAEHNSLIPSTTDRSTFYATSLTLKDLCGTSLTNFVRYWHNTALKFSQGGWFVQLDIHGGPNSAISAVLNSATAYAHRDKAFLIQFYHYYDNNPYPPGGIKLLQGWVDSTTEPLQEGDWGMYINYVDSQLDRETAQKLYYGDNLERLKLLKKKYDPTELFYYPQSIEPAM